jgi:ATP-binding cassette subfamily C exporter for protease/lipase
MRQRHRSVQDDTVKLPAPPPNEILQALRRCRSGFVQVALFSAVINLLMLAPALYMLQVYDRVLGSGNAMTLLMLTLLIVGLFAVMGILEWVRSLMMIRLGAQLDLHLNARVFAATFAANLHDPQQRNVQPLNDLASLRQFATGSGLFAFFDAPWFPLYLAVIFLFSPWLGLLALAGAAALLGLAWLNQRLCREPLAEAGRLSIAAGEQAGANLRQADAIEAMGMLGALRARWLHLHHGFLNQHHVASERAAAISAWSRYVRLSLQSLVLGLGAWLVLQGQISAGMMIAGSLLMGRVLAPIDQLIGIWKHWIAARQAYGRLTTLLQAQPPRATAMALPAPRGALSVERLCALAPGSRAPCLADLSFRLPAGQMLGVLGASGSGKSTLARLLVGVAPAQSGKVRLDSADLRQWDKVALGKHLGYLPQDVQLFAGTVAENIARFTFTDAQQVVDAAQLAGVHELILRLPLGYDTPLGEGGSGLSGGQKQRIGLARAFYGLPALIVLDEPNANLDEAGERALLAAIARIKSLSRTLVVITHKPTLLNAADLLLILHGGQMKAFGPAASVLAELQSLTATSAQGLAS